MKYKKLVLLLIVILMFNCFLLTNNDLFVFANGPYKGMCVIDESGQVLYEHNKDVKLPMASTTKIITAITVIENVRDLEKVVTVSDAAVGIEGTSIYLRKNEEISIRNLLYGLILASGNDAAVALACAVSGTEDEFVKLMNDFVLKLGLKNTMLKNSHGLDCDGHYTSAYDLAYITNYALNNDVFAEIVSTKTMVLNEGEQDVRYLRNKNKLLFSQEGCIGVKTGFTDNAGRCLVNACNRNGFRTVSVVLNCGPMFEECDKLTELSYLNYELKTFIEPYSFVGNASVLNGDKEEANVITIKGFSKIINKQDLDKYKVEFNIYEGVEAPITANTKMGEVKVYFCDDLIYCDWLYSTNEIENINLRSKLDTIIKNWFI